MNRKAILTLVLLCGSGCAAEIQRDINGKKDTIKVKVEKEKAAGEVKVQSGVQCAPGPDVVGDESEEEPQLGG